MTASKLSLVTSGLNIIKMIHPDLATRTTSKKLSLINSEDILITQKGLRKQRNNRQFSSQAKEKLRYQNKRQTVINWG
jgi:hypothetical protein